MKFKFLVCFLIFIPLFIQAQESSSLFQLVTSDLQVQSPAINRELQTFLAGEMKKEIPGVTIPIVRDKILSLKNELLGFTSKILDNKGKFTKEHVDSLQSQLQKKIEAFLSKEFSEDSIVESFLMEAVSSLIVGSTKNKETKESLSNPAKLYKSFASLLSTYVVEDLLELKKRVAQFSAMADKLAEMYRKFVINLTDKMQIALQEEIEKPLGTKFKGVLGAKVGEDSKLFSGGLMYLLEFSTKTKFALYLNSNFNSPDTSNVRSLFGFKFTYLCSCLQLDLLGGGFFGESKFLDVHGLELGFGANFLLGGENVIGLAGFYQSNKTISEDNFYTLGISYKFSKAYPAFVFGFTGFENKKSQVFIQLNQPIFFN